MSKPIAAAIALTLATLVASAWWLQRPEPTDRVSPRAAAAKSGRSIAPVTAAPAPKPPAVVAESSWDPQLVQRAEHKYRYLLGDLRLSPRQLAELRELLLQSEQLRTVAHIASGEDPDLDPLEVGRIKQALAALDARIQTLLNAAQFARYESLRDSDVEQEHLAQYSGGVSAMAPLAPAQERTILEARLRHKARFQAGLRDFGLDRESLSTEERRYAHANVGQSLQEYRDNFLAEVRPSLTEEQYFLLSNYETTEFARELERLQTLINSK